MIDLARAAGRYGAFIWPAYGLSAAGFAAMIVETALRARRWRRAARQAAEAVAEEAEAEPRGADR